VSSKRTKASPKKSAKPYQIKPYYERDGVALFLGQAEDVVPTFAERGHVVMDPPYSEHTHGKSRTGKRAPQKDGRGNESKASFSRVAEFGFDHLTPSLRTFLAREAARLAERWVLVFSDIEGATWWRLALLAAGLEYVRTGAWVKEGATPQFSGDRPATGFESITIAHPKGRKKWNGGGRHGVWSVPIVLERGGGKANGTGEPRIHTTQKPERLMIALVQDFTSPGDLVYDLTMGAGTTAIGCLRAAGGPRRFVGVEREERWIEAAAKRLDAELNGSTFHAQARGQLSLLGETT